MKKILLLSFLISLCATWSNAQCDYVNGDMEDWTLTPLEFDGVVSNVWLPDNHLSAVRLITNIFFADFDLAPWNTMFEDDPQLFFGFDRSTDASEGTYAIKLQGDDLTGFSDLVSGIACDTPPDSLRLDIKHVGQNQDTIYIYSAIDQNTPSIPADFTNGLDTLPYYLVDSIIIDGDSAYTTYTFPYFENTDTVDLDSMVFYTFVTHGPNSYWLIDNIQLVTATTLADDDMDGFTVDVDCNDNNPNVFPGATEVCNGIDDNCDGQIDEGLLSTFYLDSDGDGFGNAAMSLQDCSAPANYVTNSDDCDDSNPNINPDETESCNGLDDNCDGNIDEGVQTTYYLDSDGDGFGNAAMSILDCSAPTNYVTNDQDCDDSDVNEFPGQVWYVDGDGDGVGDGTSQVSCERPMGLFLATELSAADGDCNDNDPTTFPGANEICDGIDNNCNGMTDENVVFQDYFLDGDGDGFGAGTAVNDCVSPGTNYVLQSGDCNDSDPSVNPGADEACNGLDDNCNGQIDEGVLSTFFLDSDGDGFGDAASSLQDCSAPTNYVTNSDDCNDADPAVFPGATEVCDDVDNDCDGMIDEGLSTLQYFIDSDGDGFGTGMAVLDCQSPGANYVTQAGDCDDSNPAINPGASESCNGLDDNCNGQIDEGVLSTFFLDSDGDGFGDAASSVQDCSAPANYVSNSDDCNDADPAVFPGATESCNGVDDNCDGQIDEGLTTTYYADSDMDGFGDPNNFAQECDLPPGFVENSDDCDDSNPGINPNATEIPNNGIDEDCDGMDDPSNVDELAELGIRVYPNPVSDFIYLENVPAAGFHVEMINLVGQRVLSNQSLNHSQINASQLVDGAYFLKITETSTMRKKVVLLIKN
ncbi:MAG: MopE-related protein [Bacteroidota bacterium]